MTGNVRKTYVLSGLEINTCRQGLEKLSAFYYYRTIKRRMLERIVEIFISLLFLKRTPSWIAKAYDIIIIARSSYFCIKVDNW